MTRDDIIRMAREVGLRITFDPDDPDDEDYEPMWFVGEDRGDTLTRFFNLAYEAGAAAERKGEHMTETVLTWVSGSPPPDGAKCFVLWRGDDRVHTACWFLNTFQSDCWVTSAGRIVRGMDGVEMYAIQPDVSLLRRQHDAVSTEAQD